MTQPRLSVVVASLGRFAPLLRTVAELLAQDIEAEVVVVDQNPSWPVEHEDARSALERHPRVRWIQRHPPGVVAARNAGVETATGDVLVFVDDDVSIPDPAFLRRHLEGLAELRVEMLSGRELKRETSHLGGSVAAAPTVEVDPVSAATLLGFDRSSSRRARGCVGWSTCNGSITRAAFLQLGGFDEGFGPASYGDDADLAMRWLKGGGAIGFEPGAWLVHLLEPVGGLRATDPANRTSEDERALSGWVFTLRHGRGSRWRLFRGWVLRRTLLARRNVLRPWRWPSIGVALLRSYRRARAIADAPPRSRFRPR